MKRTALTVAVLLSIFLAHESSMACAEYEFYVFKELRMDMSYAFVNDYLGSMDIELAKVGENRYAFGDKWRGMDAHINLDFYKSNKVDRLGKVRIKTHFPNDKTALKFMANVVKSFDSQYGKHVESKQDDNYSWQVKAIMEINMSLAAKQNGMELTVEFISEEGNKST